MKRPDVLAGVAHKVVMGCGNVYITINTRFGDPIEIFCKLGKSGGCQGSLLSGVARLASIALQDGTQPERIADTLKGITCPQTMPGEKGAGPASCLDALARLLVESDDTVTHNGKGG